MGLQEVSAQARTAEFVPTLRSLNERVTQDGRGITRAAYRLGVDAAGLEPVEALEARFGWDPSTLNLLEESRTGRSTHRLYRQTIDGIPVWNRLVRVSLDSEDRITMVVSGYDPSVEGLDTQPAVSSSGARLRARSAVANVLGPQAPDALDSRASQPELVAVPGITPRLAWRVMVWPVSPIAEYEVLVDARDSQVLHLEDQTVRRTGLSGRAEPFSLSRLRYASRSAGPVPTASAQQGAASPIVLDATGTVFDPDPLATSGSDYVSPFVDDNDATTPEIDAEMKTVTLRDVTVGVDGAVRLSGPHVSIVGFNTGGVDVYSPPAETSGQFFYNRSQSGFEAVNVYYHIDQNQRYIQSLGIHDLQSDSPIPVNPQGSSADDSGWLANQRFLFFGTGGVDDGEDAAVVIHEYGHALLEGGAPGLRGTLEGQALHEGWSDYWAMSYQRGLMESGALARDDWQEVFRWDSGLGSIWSGRRLDFVGEYPGDTCSDGGSGGSCSVHNDGRLWGTVMMEVYTDLGKDVTDKLNLWSHRYLTSPVTFADAAEAVIQADIDHFGGQHVESLINRFAPRGLVDASAFGPVVTHQQLAATEDLGGTAEIEVTAKAIAATLDVVEVHWRHDQGGFSTIQLSDSGSGAYRGFIPLPAAPGTVEYFIQAVDSEDRVSLSPFDAPATVFSFLVGPDSEAPSIGHTPIAGLSLAQWPPTIRASVTDQYGVASASVRWSVAIPGQPERSGSYLLEETGGVWTGGIPVLASQVAVGTSVSYSIVAVDRSSAMNSAEVGPFAFEVSGTGVLRTFPAESSMQMVQLSGVFEAGRPALGTNVAHSGTTVWGTDPDGVYPAVSGVSTLELPASNLSGSGTPMLSFWHWYDTEHDGRADPSLAGGDVLWDGGNVKISTDGGISWAVLEPTSGYPGSIIGGPDNPMAGQSAFGGFSFGWRREVMPLPATEDVRLRFDFGTDATNTEQARFFAGWLLDDVVITNRLPNGSGLPGLTEQPLAVVSSPSGSPLPPVEASVTDDIGVSDVWVEYEYSASGGTTSGEARLTQSPNSLTAYAGAVGVLALTAPGDRLVWRLRLGDVDGNVISVPAASAPGFVVNVRLAKSTPLLASAAGGEGWSQSGVTWTGQGEGAGGLVFQPVTIARNGAVASFVFEHAYRFGVDSGGQIQVSRDDGATWALATPTAGYGGVLSGEDAFRGTSAARQDRVDFSLLAGDVVQIRLMVSGDSQLTRWTVTDAVFSQETEASAFDFPEETVLHANFPDPFTVATNISYSLPAAAPVLLTVHDMLGRRVATLDNGMREAGNHNAVLRGDNLASGVYLLRLDTGATVKFEMITVAR